ncbi:hypothetical protein CH252_32805 [Rhodococcus sp. 06-1477-1B]|nr:hypothetical protein CH252_32805 [Rhodococcus sp. 06-1477-1B]
MELTVTEIASTRFDSVARPSLSRRTIIAGAAWSVPAIVAASATPAFAVSGAATLALSSPNMQVVAAGTTPVSTRVTDAGGQPLAGRAVTLTGPSGTSFSPATPTTDGAGTATSTLTTTTPWATPGSSLTVAATTAGGNTSAALTVLGANAYSVGFNWSAQLGTPVDGNTKSVPTPAQLSFAFPSPIRSATAGNGFSIALLDNGTVWAIGDNSSGTFGTSTPTYRESWAPVPGLAGVTQIAVSSATVYALLSDGTVSAWGNNSDGQLGTGGVVSSSTPTIVRGVTGATQIAAGDRNGYALVANGQIRAWGANGLGQIGNGVVDNNIYPATTVLNVSGATQIAVTRDTAYALVSGTVYGWGHGGDGKLTDTTTSWENPHARALSGISGATAIAAGGTTGYALVGGNVKAWGAGDVGQLGNNTTNNASLPVIVSGLANVSAIAGSSASAYALSPAGLSAWGSNDNGQLGDGTYTNRNAPITVQNTTGVTALMPPSNTGGRSAFFIRHQTTTLTVTSPNMRAIAAGATTVTAVLTDAVGNPSGGVTLTWSGPSGATFAPASVTTDSTGTATTTLTTTNNWATPGSTIAVSATSGATTGTAALTVLGANAYGSGALFAADAVPPEQLPLVFPSPIRSIATGDDYMLALLQDGTVWSTGANGSGQLGDGTNTDRTTWAKIPTLSGVTAIAVLGDSSNPASFALLSSGGVMSWGNNSYGQLGIGSTTSSAVPVAVSNITNATQLATGYRIGLALGSDGKIRAWGGSFYNEIPTGATTTPVIVANPTGSTVKPVPATVVTQIAAGSFTVYAIVGGQVYSWGLGQSGEAGNGKTTTVNSPGAVSGLTNVTQVAAAYSTGYALTGGLVKAWGKNDGGQLGNNTGNTNALSPVSVSTLTGVTKIAASDTTAHAITANGVYGWGGNSLSQVGDGTFTTRRTPVPVVGVQNVTGLSLDGCASDSVCFIR